MTDPALYVVLDRGVTNGRELTDILSGKGFAAEGDVE